MKLLSKNQKELLFDYCMGLTAGEQTLDAEKLISSNPQADTLYNKLKTSLAPLESLQDEVCPDELVESTVCRLNNLARSSQTHLQQLLAAEQAQPTVIKGLFWRLTASRFATAALFMIVGAVAITSFNILKIYARQKALQYQCQRQLANIFGGISQYAGDNDGRLPAVAMSAGAPWWKVGSQGEENQSNTRHLWLLPKGGYVRSADFVCPGKKQRLVIRRFNDSQIQKFRDFPARNYVTYSFRIMSGKPGRSRLAARSALMSDMSPLFEILPSCECDSLEDFELSKDLATRNSSNHNFRGQNILFSDGSVHFKKKRCIGLSGDDIFTLQNIREYKGVEVPTCERDTFLAP